jgi:SH3-like domain-containing protein
MKLMTHARRIVAAASLCLTALTPALAQDMVSVEGRIVNMRAGPSTQARVLWELDKGYPLKVIKRKGSWLQVRDVENDRGWVARSLTGSKPHHVVKSKVANIRKGPGQQYRIIGRAEQYELMRTREKKSGWVRVERTSGQTGWISKKLLWGW